MEGIGKYDWPKNDYVNTKRHKNYINNHYQFCLPYKINPRNLD